MTPSRRQSPLRLSVRLPDAILSKGLTARTGRRFGIPSYLFLARVTVHSFGAERSRLRRDA
jgi:hypothetical protein